MITTSWTKAGNEKEEHASERLPGDTDTEFESMHFSAAKEKLGEYPPLGDHPLVTKYDLAGGGTTTVTTPRQPNETDRAWIERHVLEAEEAMSLLPPL